MPAISISDLISRQRACIRRGDALGTVIYRPPTPEMLFLDCDSGRVFATSERTRYQRSKAYRVRRAEILLAKGRCDHCGAPPASLWAADSDAFGRETPDNTVVLCRHCNNRAYRAREQLGLVA